MISHVFNKLKIFAAANVTLQQQITYGLVAKHSSIGKEKIARYEPCLSAVREHVVFYGGTKWSFAPSIEANYLIY